MPMMCYSVDFSSVSFAVLPHHGKAHSCAGRFMKLSDGDVVLVQCGSTLSWDPSARFECDRSSMEIGTTSTRIGQSNVPSGFYLDQAWCLLRQQPMSRS